MGIKAARTIVNQHIAGIKVDATKLQDALAVTDEAERAGEIARWMQREDTRVAWRPASTR